MSKASHRFELSPVLDITGAHALREACLGLVTKRSTITLDASLVERITTPAIQILVSLIKSRRESGYGTQIAAASETFEKTVATLGLASFFAQEQVHG